MYYFMSMMVVAWITVIQLSVINNKKSVCVSRAKICTLGGVDKIGIGPAWITDWIMDRITEKKSFKVKQIQKHQIIYELVINKK